MLPDPPATTSPDALRASDPSDALPPGAALAAERVESRYGAKPVLRGVSFEAPAGAVTCLLGPSGCGKTTLLRVLAGIERPSAGRVLLDGVEVAGPARFVAAESRRVGLMFQDYALFPHLSVLGNVLFGLRDLPRREACRIAEAALSRVGLLSFAARRPDQLSGGERQRVALARAMAPSPRALLLDEPFSNLDRSLRDELRDATAALLRRSRITAIVVTHDPDEAMQVADRLVLLAEGRVLAAGSPEDLYRRPCSLEVARALSDVNEVAGRVAGGRLATPLGAFPIPSPRPEGSAGLAAIRPEGVRIAGPGRGRPGRIASRVFRAGSTLARIEVEGLDAPLRSTAPLAGMSAGDAVSVEIAPDGVSTFVP